MGKMKLLDKKVAITGASSGIGRATALRMAMEGADVALTARNRERLDEVADAVRALGRKAVVIEADVTDTEEIKRAVDTAIEALGGLLCSSATPGSICAARQRTCGWIRSAS